MFLGCLTSSYSLTIDSQRALHACSNFFFVSLMCFCSVRDALGNANGISDVVVFIGISVSDTDVGAKMGVSASVVFLNNLGSILA